MTGGRWVVVLALSLLTPVLVRVDKAIQIHRQGRVDRVPTAAGKDR